MVPLILVLCLAAGAGADFLVNGVLKIVWFVIYAPTYLALAKGVELKLAQTRWASRGWLAVGVFLAGAAGAHLCFMGRVGTFTYSMMKISSAPLTLGSENWVETLVVASERVTQAVGASTEIPVIAETKTDYGCLRSFTVVTVAGVDVRSDPSASWTFKSPKQNAPLHTFEPGEEDRRLPWCRIKFYGG